MRHFALALSVLLGWAPAAGAQAEGVGVAPFEVVPAGQSQPELGVLVADRLVLRGVGRVAGPSELAAPARFEPSPTEAQGWARAANVDALVVGRTTRIGDGLSIDAKLIDGVTGKPLGNPVVEQAARSEDLGRAIDRLTGTLLARLAARPRAVSTPSTAATPAKKERTGASFGRGKPLSIQSDQLESQMEAGGRRHLTFDGHVRAVQGDLKLSADRLDAYSAADQTEPDRLTARGHVTMEQGGRLAHCAEAEFFRTEDRVVCTGQLAEIEQGCDRVRGPRIVFHLGSERLEVEGGADVQLRPDEPGCGVAAATTAGSER